MGSYQVAETPSNRYDETMKTKFAVFSFFSGSGFLDLGFEDQGFHVDYVNENHVPFLEAYKYSRLRLGKEVPRHGYSSADIQTLLTNENLANLGSSIRESRKHSEYLGFIAGPPCPDFSVGGKNRGHEGDKGKLSEIYVEMIISHKPDFFLFENVKGLWRTQKHRRFYEHLKKRLIEHDYVVSERLINSIEFGVPQDRDRIILMGFKKAFLSKEFINKNVIVGQVSQERFPWCIKPNHVKERILSLPWPNTNEFDKDGSLPFVYDVPENLTVEYWFQRNDVYNHPNAAFHFAPRAGFAKMLEIKEGDTSKKSYKRLHRWRYSPTAAYGNNEVHLHPYKARRISASEALAIQSLPKEFILPETMTLSNMFKTIGNGVPYLASRGVASTMQRFMEGFV